jgi:hypothetical protein
VGDIEFLNDFCRENSNKFHETRFWKEKSVENVVTLGPTAQATLVLIEAEIWDTVLVQFCEHLWTQQELPP